MNRMPGEATREEFSQTALAEGSPGASDLQNPPLPTPEQADAISESRIQIAVTRGAIAGAAWRHRYEEKKG